MKHSLVSIFTEFQKYVEMLKAAKYVWINWDNPNRLVVAAPCVSPSFHLHLNHAYIQGCLTSFLLEVHISRLILYHLIFLFQCKCLGNSRNWVPLTFSHSPMKSGVFQNIGKINGYRVLCHNLAGELHLICHIFLALWATGVVTFNYKLFDNRILKGNNVLKIGVLIFCD